MRHADAIDNMKRNQFSKCPLLSRVSSLLASANRSMWYTMDVFLHIIHANSGNTYSGLTRLAAADRRPLAADSYRTADARRMLTGRGERIQNEQAAPLLNDFEYTISFDIGRECNRRLRSRLNPEQVPAVLVNVSISSRVRPLVSSRHGTP